MATALVYEERCLAHDNGSMLLDPRAAEWLDVGHVESAERVARAFRVLERSGVAERLERVPARPAAVEELLLVHTAGHVDRVREACERGEQLVVGPEARVGADSWEPALLSAGGALAVVEWVLDRGEGASAYVLTRPPGHHASADQAMGFCLFNNVALAARRAQQLGVERVAIVDWDVHHGNGTEDVFAEDPSVLFVSLHQDGLYPADRGRAGIRHRGRAGDDRQRAAAGGKRRRRLPAAVEEASSPPCAPSAPISCCSQPARTRPRRIRLAG